MKLLFISDIHGSLPALERAIAKFKAHQADYLVILGDALYHGPRNPIPEGYAPADCATLLNEFAEQIIAIRGNCDSEVDQMLIDYPMMEANATLLVDGRRFFLSHGHLFNPENLPPLTAGDVFGFGHVHLPIAETNANGIHIFNPGSITLPKQNNPASYGLYQAGMLSVFNFDDEPLRQLKIS